MSSAQHAAVHVEDVHKSFGDVQALRGISFSAERGTVLGILGPNGAGKTTTVKVLSTLIAPDRGRAFVAGHDVAADAPAVRRSIMMTGQYAALDDTLSGRENIELFGRLMGLDKKAAKARAKALLDEFDLSDTGKRPVRGYSGGMRRRIDIACGLVVRPEVVFLDEPTTGLDPESRRNTWRLIQELKNSGVTIMLTTHYLDEAESLCDRLAIMHRGRVVRSGTVDEVVADHPAKIELQAPGTALPTLPGTSIDVSGDTISIQTSSIQDTLTDLLVWARTNGVTLHGLDARAASLETVFLSIADEFDNPDFTHTKVMSA